MYFLLPQIYQGQGFAKPVLLESLQQYKNMQAKMVRVHAGLSGGGYTWAKYGFVATQRDEMERILADARITLQHEPHIAAEMEHIFKSYYNKYPLGNEFPIVLWADLPGTKAVLHGSNWHGILNLDDDEQIRTFITYVTAI